MKIKGFRHLCLLLMMFTIFDCQSQHEEDMSLEERVEGLLKEYPGLSIAVGLGKDLVYEKGFGFADVAAGLNVRPIHQFRYYSLSKSITGMALVKLIEEGKLDIEKPISFYLDQLPEAYNDVKVKQLINHSAGVRHYNRGEWEEISKDHCDLTAEAIATFINDPLESKPGEKYEYSSFGYVLLSHLIATVSEQPYEQYLEEALFAPLGLENIHIDRSPEIEHEVAYYSSWNQKKAKGKLAREVNNTCKYGGGALVGTAADLVRLHLAFINQEVVGQTLTRQYYSAIPISADERGNAAFGIGDAQTDSGLRYHFHSGAALGANGALLVYEPHAERKEPLVVVVLGNLKDDKMNSEMSAIANYFIKASTRQ